MLFRLLYLLCACIYLLSLSIVRVGRVSCVTLKSVSGMVVTLYGCRRCGFINLKSGSSRAYCLKKKQISERDAARLSHTYHYLYVPILQEFFKTSEYNFRITKIKGSG
jgi:hypothetical protein